MPPWNYFLSLPVAFVLAAFLFNVVTGVFGINSMTLRRSWPLLTIGGILAFVAAWQTAAQNWENQKLVENITGGDSYPAVVPEFLKDDGSVPLHIWNRGHSILSGVTILIWEPGDFDPSHWKSFDIGTLPSKDAFNVGRPVRYSLVPKFDETAISADGEKVANYNLFITAQNGMTVEVLQFKRGLCSTLSYRFWILKNEKEDDNSVSQKLLEQTKWLERPCP